MSHSLSYVDTGFVSSGTCILIVVFIKDKKNIASGGCWGVQRRVIEWKAMSGDRRIRVQKGLN